MKIRPATTADLYDVSIVHRECFPATEHYTTLMGGGQNRHKNLTGLMYLEYLRAGNPFLVAEDQNKIIGFCMGYFYNSDAMGTFYKKHRWQFVRRTCALLLQGNSLAWRKVSTALTKPFRKEEVGKRMSQDINQPSASLLSIGVLPAYQGKGISSMLVTEYEQVLKQHGVKAYTLSTWPKNYRAIAFYQKMGLRERYRFSNSVKFIKDLE